MLFTDSRYTFIECTDMGDFWATRILEGNSFQR